MNQNEATSIVRKRIESARERYENAEAIQVRLNREDVLALTEKSCPKNAEPLRAGCERENRPSHFVLTVSEADRLLEECASNTKTKAKNGDIDAGTGN